MSGPILVFDSGMGGLSVLNAIKSVLPQATYCYLFDNARLPYGELDEQDLVEGCVTLISQVVKQMNASLVVVACNTASTLVLPILRQQLNIPIVGVVPAIKPAAEHSRSKKIGLLATPATITRIYTHDLIEQFASDCEVYLFGSSQLVLLAEDKVVGREIDEHIIEHILQPIKNASIDTLVLGCTHFPILRAEIQQVLGLEVTLLDSEQAIASRVKSLLGDEMNFSDEPLCTAFYTAAEITPSLRGKLANDGFVNVSQFHIG
ncbi:glutamate racemase [Shewanella surugensis]|uniref:Glutamate racemase n=1 Tax=Shewanella surugensis TaxID=212020 RepID=A0ABT0L8X3_9GAMM|nr:glutamate racemase [Shewanella surugensis]MCL1123999.1 glutamate racemase [Shewanella surugensis]